MTDKLDTNEISTEVKNKSSSRSHDTLIIVIRLYNTCTFVKNKEKVRTHAIERYDVRKVEDTKIGTCHSCTPYVHFLLAH